MATAQLQIGDIVARELRAASESKVNWAQSLSIVGNINKADVSFATFTGDRQFAGTANTNIMDGTSGITGTLSSDTILSGDFYFLFNVQSANTLLMLFYSDSSYATKVGVLTATGSFSGAVANAGHGTGKFTP